MTDKEFFEAIHAAWAQTSHAEDSYWEPKRMGDTWSVYAVTRTGERHLIAVALSRADADFMCAVHATLPDLVRRLTAAIEEAEQADKDRDEREQLIAELLRGRDGVT